jgi:hypothetical protein
MTVTTRAIRRARTVRDGPTIAIPTAGEAKIDVDPRIGASSNAQATRSHPGSEMTTPNAVGAKTPGGKAAIIGTRIAVTIVAMAAITTATAAQVPADMRIGMTIAGRSPEAGPAKRITTEAGETS